MPVVPGLDAFLLEKEEVRSADRDERDRQRVGNSLRSRIAEVMAAGAAFSDLRSGRLPGQSGETQSEDDGALTVACRCPVGCPWIGRRLAC